MVAAKKPARTAAAKKAPAKKPTDAAAPAAEPNPVGRPRLFEGESVRNRIFYIPDSLWDFFAHYGKGNAAKGLRDAAADLGWTPQWKKPAKPRKKAAKKGTDNG